MFNTLICCMALISAAQPATDKPFNAIRLVVGYDQSANSKTMFPVLAKLREAGYDIVYANLDEPKNAKYLEAFELNENKLMPCYLMYVGHEAFEKNNGIMTTEALTSWYNRAAKGQSTPKMVKPTQQKDYLQNSPINTVYLRRRLSEPSCGMLWCVAHRQEILEYVDKDGNVIKRIK